MPQDYFSAVQTYNTRISEIWPKLFRSVVNLQGVVKLLPPLLHPAQNNSPVWFLGMNPSDGGEGWIYGDHDWSFCQDSAQVPDGLRIEIEKRQRECHLTHKYFGQLLKFNNSEEFLNRRKNGPPVFHDLYPIRHTNQAEFERFLKSEAACKLRQELNAAVKEFIESCCPKLIVVFNAKASSLLQDIFGISDKTLKTHHSVNGSTFVYSSMYSGQHSLDNFSKVRLAREIKEILET